MKKRLLAALALVTTLGLVGSTIAEAADIKFSGQLRPRWEYQDRDLNSETDGNTTVDGRVRLNALATIDDKTSAFIQLQAIRSWGEGNGSFTANDSDETVGIHQGFFTIKEIYGTALDLQFGRQEFILDGHRIFGDTLWTAGEQTHDGVRLSRVHGNHAFVYFFARGDNERTTEASVATQAAVDNDEGDNDLNIDIHALYAQFKGVLGGTLSLHYNVLINDSNAGQSNNVNTIGFRQAGKYHGLNYRGEFYYQWGDTESHGLGWDHSAYMGGIRIGRGFGGSLKPNLTLWFDYLSGTDANDLNNNDTASFDTVFDTGHKFYGFMDYWLNIGAAGRSGNVQSDQLNGLGLIDFAVKGAITPMQNWKLGAHLHFMWTAEDAYSGGINTYQAKTIGENHLGEELDVTLTHNYSPSTKIVYGYSHFFADDLMEDINHRFSSGNADDDGDWAYIMVDVQF